MEESNLLSREEIEILCDEIYGLYYDEQLNMGVCIQCEYPLMSIVELHILRRTIFNAKCGEVAKGYEYINEGHEMEYECGGCLKHDDIASMPLTHIHGDCPKGILTKIILHNEAVWRSEL